MTESVCWEHSHYYFVLYISKRMFNVEKVFDMYVFFHAIVFSCNIVVFLLSNKIDKKSKILCSCLYWYRTVLYTLFHLSQLMTVYPFKHTTALKQFMN